MAVQEISLDSMTRGAEPNRASLIRDAVIEAEPELCHGCPKAFERSYDIGQTALKEGWTPEKAATEAWGNIGACCRTCVDLQIIPVVITPSEHRELQLA
ncbi:MAG: hypothetical protein M3Q14_00455 [bacterium]|nr:hypothetical protein [bacterium]